MSRRRPNPAGLRINTPMNAPHIAIAVGDSSASTSALSSDDDRSPFSSKPRSLRNMKGLSLNLSSAQSSTNSLAIPSDPASAASSQPAFQRKRRPSVISLPAPTSGKPSAPAAALLHRKEELGSPTIPYADGPIQILPGIWLGSEDNARDWKGLMERGIKAILNVAKEVASPFDSDAAARSLRHTVSSPNLAQKSAQDDATYYPVQPSSGRPGMHYLKLMWSHGQQDLVENGFQEAMAFTDAAIERSEGVLIHCQCGISRSATMVIALVMRAAAERSPSVPSEVWALKGMQGAYTFVKSKSRWAGPNMSLIYQLLDYERKLGGGVSPSASEKSSNIADEEEEWGRKRRLLDEAPSDNDDERESSIVMQEAQALDKAMEDRIVARKSSSSSFGSSSGVGMGTAWRNQYKTRKRTGSIASNMTNGSIISEDLVEEDEEEGLLGVGGGFDSDRAPSTELTSATNSPEDDSASSRHMRSSSRKPSLESARAADSKVTPTKTPATARPPVPVLRPPPSAPIWKTSFNIPPPPATAARSTFDLPPRGPGSFAKGKKKPQGLGILPPVPSSPIAIVVASDSESEQEQAPSTQSLPSEAPETTVVVDEPQASSVPYEAPLPSARIRTDSVRRPVPPPLSLRSSATKRANRLSLQSLASNSSTVTSTSSTSSHRQSLATPSQTLFVFPPSPTNGDSKTPYANMARTPSTMTLTTAGLLPFPSMSTPRVSTFRSTQGRTRSFIGLGPPPTPTTAFSKVDARGYVGLE